MAKNTKSHKIPWVMEQLGISRSQVYRLIDDGELIKIKIGRLARITDASFQAYFERLQEAA